MAAGSGDAQDTAGDTTSHEATPNQSSALMSFSMARGVVVLPYRFTTLPLRSTRNLLRAVRQAGGQGGREGNDGQSVQQSGQ